MTVNLLVIEDDQIVIHTIERILRKDYRVRVASSGIEGLQSARREVPDLVILDVIMPGMDGFTVCKEMRQDALLCDIPILFLTAKTRDEDKITGLSAGADDYLGKPFNVDELLLRVKAILRRTQRMKVQSVPDVDRAPEHDSAQPRVKVDPGQMIVVGDYTLNTRSFEFSGPGITRFRLTPVQYDLLYHLMTHLGEIFSPARLLDEVWDYPSDAGSPDLVRVHIKNLREKTEEDPRNPKFILTVPGFGYTIQAPK
jgi:two-component system, OmpR family, response regulator RpaA